MRNLRAIYNRAVAKELTVQRFPFKQVYTGIDKTVKRAVSIEVIRQIRDLDLTLHPSMEYVRDMFLFSFYTRGMSFVDMAFLLKKDLQNGVLTYRRHKTNQLLFIKWEKQMQEIIDKYDTSKEDWQTHKSFYTTYYLRSPSRMGKHCAKRRDSYCNHKQSNGT